MRKKHRMSGDEYEAYRRSHNDDHPLEAERSKIRREKADYARPQRRSKVKMEQFLRELEQETDPAAWEASLPAAEECARPQKAARRSATT